ncbi:MAG: PIN domain-containing protein [Caldilineaceae bacterium]|nr:PIN domain-containing protein [Caldilineaceae bacterium]MBP8107907.1 PIN domain-containing protein [Caldilineaceae bacterium]MBP8123789.1 PIN domain-containing protein [Caldilineaceae bacterium]MBP9073582.1 PIN domain-containing protein [Caldilineaceae bacterium]
MPDSLYIIDTHALIWYLDKDHRLSPSAKRILDDPDARLLIPAIALSEALFIVERKPHLYGFSEVDLLDDVKKDSRMRVVALNLKAIIATLDCKAIPEMHDRQIVATALLAQRAGFDVAILTRDGAIKDANLVPTLW